MTRRNFNILLLSTLLGSKNLFASENPKIIEGRCYLTSNGHCGNGTENIECIDVCPIDGIIYSKTDKERVTISDSCINCGACAEVCPMGAIE